MTLNFKISNQTLKQIGETKPANLSQEYLELDIDFKTDDWNGLTKFGLFTNQNGLKYRVALTDDKVIVPNAVLQYNKFTFSIYGVKDDVRITTNQLTIYLNDSGYVRDVENDIPDDDPTIVEEIYTAIDTKADASEMAAALDGKSDVGHTHTKSDVTDFSHTHTKSDVTDFSHTHFKSEINDFAHTHTKSDVTDFAHTHTKSDITDFPTNVSAFNNDAGYLTEHQSLEDYYNKSETDSLLDFKSNTGHTHTKSDISDFAHNHDDRYYTESEVDLIVENLKNEMNNKIILKGDKPIIQTGDTMDLTAYAVQDGMPVINEKIYFFKEEEEED